MSCQYHTSKQKPIQESNINRSKEHEERKKSNKKKKKQYSLNDPQKKNSQGLFSIHVNCYLRWREGDSNGGQGGCVGRDSKAKRRAIGTILLGLDTQCRARAIAIS
jgi:hypothetical protein